MNRASVLFAAALAALAAPAAQPQAPSTAELLAQGVDRDLRIIDKDQLSREERKQCDEAKSLARRARAMQGSEAHSHAMSASKEVAPLIRRQLKLDTLMAAAEQYRTGDARAAVQSLAESLASDLMAPVRYIEDNRDRWGVEGTALADVNDKALAALCLLETEVAFLDGYDAQARFAFASRLLGAASPGRLPSRFVERWHIAVAGHLQGYFLLAEAMQFVDEAVRRFQNDSEISLVAGTFYEFVALPSVVLGSGARPRVRGDAFVRTYATRDVVPDAPRADEQYERLVEAKRTGLARAEECYRKALAVDAGNAEAHLRLGRVLFLTSRPDAALSELRRASATKDRRIHYLAAMFEGALHEAAERPDAAIAAYQEAVQTCPQCLSGGIALSEAQRGIGSAEAAATTLDAALARDAKSLFADFWWDYLVGAYWQRDGLLRELRGGLR